MKQMAIWLCVPVLVASLCGPVVAQQRRHTGLELVLATEKTFDIEPGVHARPVITEVRYLEPRNATMVVTSQPRVFHVILRNVSDSSQRVWGGAQGALAYITFEITDEKGIKRIMKNTRDTARSTVRTGQDLGPGKQYVLNMHISPGEWENVPEWVEGEKRTLKMRIIFDNKSRKVYSEYYTLILDGTA